ncbi:anti-sigma factor, partial [Corynebacterium sphenisci]|uniref:anti-sigma factor n=1 Tax=Corynebacterium sphenisci TaxID=191493 RepID=UPI0026DF90D7
GGGGAEPADRPGAGAADAAGRPDGRGRRRRAAIVAGALLLGGLGLGVLAERVGEDAPGPDRPGVAGEADPGRIIAEAEVAGGTVRVEYAAGSDAAVVRLTDVPPPPAGSAYQMWVRDAAGSHSRGVMEADEVTPEMTAEITGIAGARGLLISMEPAGGSQRPSTPIVELPLN